MLPFRFFSSFIYIAPNRLGWRLILQKCFQNAQSRISFWLALTRTKVEVMTTLRAKTRTIWIAQRYHRNRKQNILPDCFGEINLVMLTDGKDLVLLNRRQSYPSYYVKRWVKTLFKGDM